MRVLGVDGCRGGWVAVALEDGEFVGVHVVTTIDELVPDPARVLGIDMPMGETTPGARASDVAARAFLGPRRSTIFPSPPFAAAGRSYEDAKQIAIATTGKGISKQAWNLYPKMLDASPHWEREPERLREVHPDCSFTAMAGAPLSSRKKTPEGEDERHALLAAQAIEVPRDRVRGTKPDDVLDAAAAAWTAHRIATGDAFSLPDPPELDPAGRAVAVWV